MIPHILANGNIVLVYGANDDDLFLTEEEIGPDDPRYAEARAEVERAEREQATCGDLQPGSFIIDDGHQDGSVNHFARVAAVRDKALRRKLAGEAKRRKVARA